MMNGEYTDGPPYQAGQLRQTPSGELFFVVSSMTHAEARRRGLDCAGGDDDILCWHVIILDPPAFDMRQQAWRGHYAKYDYLVSSP